MSKSDVCLPEALHVTAVDQKSREVSLVFSNHKRSRSSLWHS